MEQELRTGIERVRAMAANCKMNNDEDAVFQTNADGVSHHTLRNSFTLTSKAMSTITKSSGRLISRTNSVFH